MATTRDTNKGGGFAHCARMHACMRLRDMMCQASRLLWSTAEKRETPAGMLDCQLLFWRARLWHMLLFRDDRCAVSMSNGICRE